MPQILQDMKIRYEETDISEEEIPKYENFEKVILGFGSYSQVQEEILELADWVASGGNLLLAMSRSTARLPYGFSGRRGSERQEILIMRLRACV